MSFWSKLGKGLLKVAPIAAAFIPGVGPLASMAIGAGTSALDKKISGGSWKDALKAGAIGGATGYLGAKIPTKGIGPSKGFWGRAGDIAKRTGSTMLRDTLNQGGTRGGGTDYRTPDFNSDAGRNRSRWQDTLGDVVNRYGNRDSGMEEEDTSRAMPRSERGQKYGRDRAMERGGRGMSRFSRNMRRQLGPVMGEEDQSNPNLANALGAGRMDAMRSQPFRYGYGVTNYDYDDEGKETERIDMMPPIYPQSRGRGRGRRPQNPINDGRMY